MTTTQVTVYPEDRGMIVETDDPWLMLQKIPTAFQLDATHVGMPHGTDEVMRLQTYLRVDAPSPLLYYYRWPHDSHMVKKPFDHQFITAEFFTAHPHGFCMNGIGTGKTLSALWAADYLIETGAAHRVLIASPLSTLER